MPLEYDFDADQEILFIKATGHIDPEQVAAAGDRVTDLGVMRVLVDTRAEDSTLSYSEMIKATDALPHGVRFVMLVTTLETPAPSPHQLFVTAAQNRFKNARIYSDRDAAIAWLLEEDE